MKPEVNARYVCRVSQRLDGQAPYAMLGRDEALYSIDGIEGWAEVSEEQPESDDAPIFYDFYFDGRPYEQPELGERIEIEEPDEMDRPNGRCWRVSELNLVFE